LRSPWCRACRTAGEATMACRAMPKPVDWFSKSTRNSWLVEAICWAICSVSCRCCCFHRSTPAPATSSSRVAARGGNRRCSTGPGEFPMPPKIVVMSRFTFIRDLVPNAESLPGRVRRLRFPELNGLPEVDAYDRREIACRGGNASLRCAATIVPQQTNRHPRNKQRFQPE